MFSTSSAAGLVWFLLDKNILELIKTNLYMFNIKRYEVSKEKNDE